MNLFAYQVPDFDERFDTLIKDRCIEIVRIVSGKVEAPKEFCDEREEWVVLLKGAATLRMQNRLYHLSVGDMLHIPANTPHILESVEPGSLWLAVHWSTKK